MKFDVVVLSDLFLYAIRFFAATNIFLASLSKIRKHWVARYVLVIGILLGVVFSYHEYTAVILRAGFSVQMKDVLLELRYFTMNLLILSGLAFCYRAEIAHYLLAMIGGELFQNLVSLAIKPFESIITFDNGLYFLFHVILMVFLGGTIFVGEYVLCRHRLREIEPEVIDSGWKNCCFYLFLMSGILMINITLYYVAPAFATGVEIAVYICQAIINIGILLFMLENLNVKRANIEKHILKQILYEKEKQYMISKENIDIINCKCHDLKRQIEALRFSSDDERQAMITELMAAVGLYDSVVMTTNTTLNVLLTEKSLLCERNQIKFSCIADGDALRSISDVDLYLLLSNALDNAIENTGKIENPEERTISLVIERKGNLASIQMNNNYTGEIEVGEDGRIQTSKEDSDHHGFGLKSMEYIVKKYGGSICVATDDGIFVLQIVLPIIE